MEGRGSMYPEVPGRLQPAIYKALEMAEDVKNTGFSEMLEEY